MSAAHTPQEDSSQALFRLPNVTARPRRLHPSTPTPQPREFTVARQRPFPGPPSSTAAEIEKSTPVLRIDPAGPVISYCETFQQQATKPRRIGDGNASGGGTSTARDGFLIDHAKDLITRLAAWSMRLDAREKSLDDREWDLNRRLQTLRQLQWLAGPARSSNRKKSAAG